MKVKDLIEQLSKLNPESEIGPLVMDIKPNRRISYYEGGSGWIEEDIRYGYCGVESCGMEPGFDLCEEHLDDV